MTATAAEAARTRAATDGRGQVIGRIAEALPNAVFRVELADGRVILAHVPAPQRLRFVKLVPGDQVLVELATFDQTRGRIIRQA